MTPVPLDITRWKPVHHLNQMTTEQDGQYVAFEDHQRIVGKLLQLLRTAENGTRIPEWATWTAISKTGTLYAFDREPVWNYHFYGWQNLTGKTEDLGKVSLKGKNANETAVKLQTFIMETK